MTYTGEKIPVLSEVLIPLKYLNQQHNLPAMMVRSPGPNLLGRDWLQVIKVTWNSLTTSMRATLTCKRS